MPSITNPETIRFLTESYDKNAKLRLRWVQLHMKNFEETATYKREPKNYSNEDITETMIYASLSINTRDNINSARHRLTLQVPDYLTVKVQGGQSEPCMMPVEEDVKEILHESKKKYLKKRNNKSPEDKFCFMECSNWEYGWKLCDSELKMRGPTYGKVNKLLQDMGSRVIPLTTDDSSPTGCRALCGGI